MSFRIEDFPGPLVRIAGVLFLAVVTATPAVAQANRAPEAPRGPASFGGPEPVSALLGYAALNLLPDSTELVLADHREYEAAYRAFLKVVGRRSGIRVWDVGGVLDQCTNALFCQYPEGLVPLFLGELETSGSVTTISFVMGNGHLMVAVVESRGFEHVVVCAGRVDSAACR